MLQYRRRNLARASIPKQENEFETIPLLAYCNWSYASVYHIDLITLQNILQVFNEDYIPFYLRIFNETPTKVVEAFLEQYQISKSSLKSISQSLEVAGFKVKALF